MMLEGQVDKLMPAPRAGPGFLPGNARSNSTIPEAARRRWTINGDFTTLSPKTGVARYSREVTMALDALICEGHRLTLDLDIELVVPRPMAAPLALENIPVTVLPEYSRPRLPQFWVQAQLPRYVSGGLVSFCNLAPIALKRHIACIHDLHTRLMPSSYKRGFRWAHRLILPALGRHAARITTVSELSRSNLVEFGIAPARNIIVTYNGSDHATRWNSARSVLNIRRGRPYVLCLGQKDQAYKNLGLLARLAPLLDEMGLDLWMPGNADENALRQHVAQMPGNVVFPGRISDDDLKKLFENALCFLFPSRIEGFGLPAIEAMASGCPVVASTAPCLPEICGDAALFADPDKVDIWAENIRMLLHFPEMRAALIARGYAHASTYSWRRIAEKYLELMQEVDSDFANARR